MSTSTFGSLSAMVRRLARYWPLAAILAVLLAGLPRTLSFLGSCLVDSEPPQRADLILVLGGDFWGPRVTKAADLGLQHYAPTVLISSPPYAGRPEGELAIPFLVKQGYPQAMFEIFAHNAVSTIAEALALRQELERRHVQRVILVTAAHHSRRAMIVFRLFCPGIRFIPVAAPDANYDARRWWKQAGSRELFFSEWTKIIGTVVVAYPSYLFSHWKAGL